VLVFVSSLLVVCFGMLFQFEFFLHNNFGVLFFLFFMFSFNMISFAFMLSTFISKSSSATTVGFFFFIIGWLTEVSILLLTHHNQTPFPVHVQLHSRLPCNVV
jgi:ABC-type transport system involved in multi-copper enzyme maturation permease subunit